MLRQFGNRFIKTNEIIISKIFPAGASWQLGSILAGSFSYASNTIPFYYTVGLSEGLGVGGGHLIYNYLKKKVYDDTIDLKKETSNSLQLSTAAGLSGFVWQPVVNTLMDSTFFPTMIGTGIICGTTFYTGLRFSRIIYSPFTHVEKRTPINEVTDYQLSLSIAGATAMFVATDPNILFNVMSPYLAITENMSVVNGVYLAGLSTSLGFTSIQTLQNFKLISWLDEEHITKKTYNNVLNPQDIIEKVGEKTGTGDLPIYLREGEVAGERNTRQIDKNIDWKALDEDKIERKTTIDLTRETGRSPHLIY